jgi:predicted acylesterase/phospholipase RssA
MSDPMLEHPKKKDNLYVILALQGGGALGAFQAGAYQALTEKNYEPDWVAGISIGAINAAIIAGNPQEKRLERLKDFWRLVTGPFNWWERVPNYSEKLTNAWRIWLTMAGGVSGFFQPNYIPGPFADPNSAQASSWFNTHQLRTTLERLIDFEIINLHTTDEHVRLSLGVTRVFGGVSKTFQSFNGKNHENDPDAKRAKLSVDHVMASGALAPWFPGVYIKDQSGVVIDDQLYWDGAITSNSSFKHIIEDLPVLSQEIGDKQVVIFVIDLWGAFDREPKTFDEVCWRIKQTHYSSRIEQDIKFAREYLSNERRRERADRELLLPRIDIIRVSYHSHPNEIPCGDALFSRTEIDRRFRDGYAAMRYRLEMDPPLWKVQELSADSRLRPEARVAIHLF